MSEEYLPQWFQSPIKLPEKRVGKVRIRHNTIPVGEKISIVGIRQALLTGKKPAFGTTRTPLRVHVLEHEDYGTWMTDMPEELNQIAEMLYTVQPKGRVLVGGLGLGVLASTLVAIPQIYNTTVVEVDCDVIELCRKRGYTIVHSDIMEYLRICEEFDYFLLDTWQGTNAGTWWSKVMPMRRLIRNRFGGKPVIHCWAEDIMYGQVFRSLTNDPPHWHYENLPMPMSERTARMFLRDVGLPSWESRFGALVNSNRRSCETKSLQQEERRDTGGCRVRGQAEQVRQPIRDRKRRQS